MIQREDAFEEAYSKICKPIIARPYPRNEKGEYFYQEIHDAHLMWKEAQAVPEGFVLVETSELESLKSDNEHFTKSCIDWTDRAYKQRAKVDNIKNEVERFKQSGTSSDLGRFLDNLIEFSTFKCDAEFEGFVLVPIESLKVALFWMNEDIDPWHMGSDSFANLFEHKPILEKIMVEAQEQIHE